MYHLVIIFSILNIVCINIESIRIWFFTSFFLAGGPCEHTDDGSSTFSEQITGEIPIFTDPIQNSSEG